MKLRFNSIIIAGAMTAIASWQSGAAETVAVSEVSHIHGIAVDTVDPARLYLATHFGVFRTSPNGTAERISDNNNDYMGFSPHPSELNVFFASGHPANGGNMGIIVSRDGAQSWQQLAGGVDGPVDFHAMDVSPADPNVIFGLYGMVQVTRDGGMTWTVAGSPPADVYDIAASAVDPDIVYAATRSGVMVSLDGGRTWNPSGGKGQTASMVETSADGKVYAFVLGSGLVSTSATTLAWKTVANNFGELVLLHLAVDASNPDRMFAVTGESKILTSTDGGKNWAAFGS